MLFTNIKHLTVTRIRYGSLLLLLLSVLMGGCSKQKMPEETPAVLQVFNALEDGLMVRANLSGKHPIKYITALPISNRNRAKFNTDQAMQPVAFYAAADTMPEDSPVWSGDLQMQKGKIYSLFLVNGSKGGEGVFLEDNIPGFIKDSVTYLRFANMSNRQPVSVNIKGAPNGSLISSLAFKDVSPFLHIPCDKSVSRYVFEVRDALTGTLVAEYTANSINEYAFGNIYLFKAWTLVLTGKPGGTGVNLPRLTSAQNY